MYSLLLVRVRSVSALHTQFVGELAAGLEGTVGVATVVLSTSTLVTTVLVRSMTALDAKIVSELAASLEGAIRVTLEVVSELKIVKEGTNFTPLSLLLAPSVLSW